MSAADLTSFVYSKLRGSGILNSPSIGDMSSRHTTSSPNPRLKTVWRSKEEVQDERHRKSSFKEDSSFLRLLRTKSMPSIVIEGGSPGRYPAPGVLPYSPTASVSATLNQSSSSSIMSPITSRHVNPKRDFYADDFPDSSSNASIVTPPPSPSSFTTSHGKLMRSASDGHIMKQRRRQLREDNFDFPLGGMPSVRDLRRRFDKEQHVHSVPEIKRKTSFKSSNPKLENQSVNKNVQVIPSNGESASQAATLMPENIPNASTPNSEREELKQLQHKKLVRHESLKRWDPQQSEYQPKAADIHLPLRSVRKLSRQFEGNGQQNGGDDDDALTSNERQSRSMERSVPKRSHSKGEESQDDWTLNQSLHDYEDMNKIEVKLRSKSAPPKSMCQRDSVANIPPLVNKMKMQFENHDASRGNPTTNFALEINKKPPQKEVLYVKRDQTSLTEIKEPKYEEKMLKRQTQSKTVEPVRKISIPDTRFEVKSSLDNNSAKSLHIEKPADSHDQEKEIQECPKSPTVRDLRKRFERASVTKPSSTKFTEKDIPEQAVKNKTQSQVQFWNKPKSEDSKITPPATTEMKYNSEDMTSSTLSVRDLLRQFESKKSDSSMKNEMDDIFRYKTNDNADRRSTNQEPSPQSKYFDEPVAIKNNEVKEKDEDSDEEFYDESVLLSLADESSIGGGKSPEMLVECSKKGLLKRDFSQRESSDEFSSEDEERRLVSEMENEEEQSQKEVDGQQKRGQMESKRMDADIGEAKTGQNERMQLEVAKDRSSARRSREELIMEFDVQGNSENEQEKINQERIEHEKAKQEQQRKNEEEAYQEKLRLEKMEREKAEQERQEREARERVAEQERVEREKAEKEQLKKEKAEQELREKVKAEQQRIEKENAEQESIAKERAEQDRRAKEREEQERIAKEKADQERLAMEKAEQERLAMEKAEQERKSKENAEKERMEKERLEREREMQEKLERDKAEERREERRKREEAEQKERQGQEQETIEREITEDSRKPERDKEEGKGTEPDEQYVGVKKEYELGLNAESEKETLSEKRKQQNTAEMELRDKQWAENERLKREQETRDLQGNRKVGALVDKFMATEEPKEYKKERGGSIKMEDDEQPEVKVGHLIDKFIKNKEISDDERPSEAPKNFKKERRESDVALLIGKFANMKRRTSSSSSHSSDGGKEAAPIPKVATKNIPGKTRVLREDEMKFFMQGSEALGTFTRSQSMRVKNKEPAPFLQRGGSVRVNSSQPHPLAGNSRNMPKTCRQLRPEERRFFDMGNNNNIYQVKKNKGKTTKDSKQDFRLVSQGTQGEELARGFPGDDPTVHDTDSDSDASLLRDDEYEDTLDEALILQEEDLRLYVTSHCDSGDDEHEAHNTSFTNIDYELLGDPGMAGMESLINNNPEQELTSHIPPYRHLDYLSLPVRDEQGGIKHNSPDDYIHEYNGNEDNSNGNASQNANIEYRQCDIPKIIVDMDLSSIPISIIEDEKENLRNINAEDPIKCSTIDSRNVGGSSSEDSDNETSLLKPEMLNKGGAYTYTLQLPNVCDNIVDQNAATTAPNENLQKDMENTLEKKGALASLEGDISNREYTEVIKEDLRHNQDPVEIHIEEIEVSKSESMINQDPVEVHTEDTAAGKGNSKNNQEPVEIHIEKIESIKDDSTNNQGPVDFHIEEVEVCKDGSVNNENNVEVYNEEKEVTKEDSKNNGGSVEVHIEEIETSKEDSISNQNPVDFHTEEIKVCKDGSMNNKDNLAEIETSKDDSGNNQGPVEFHIEKIETTKEDSTNNQGLDEVHTEEESDIDTRPIEDYILHIDESQEYLSDKDFAMFCVMVA